MLCTTMALLEQARSTQCLDYIFPKNPLPFLPLRQVNVLLTKSTAMYDEQIAATRSCVLSRSTSSLLPSSHRDSTTMSRITKHDPASLTNLVEKRSENSYEKAERFTRVLYEDATTTRFSDKAEKAMQYLQDKSAKYSE